ncbi:unnamed protein product [Arctia plantaginis]|uniref:Uncharacterized protein n=1 Tax=Arctia plantaginis TaxID=874455 RepID=A0A8S1A5F8_ARCPL|nr:unnamed protein product [Arctia plantaginis]CAB3240243.1 unnamed protein product [Arctia plantaginis]
MQQSSQWLLARWMRLIKVCVFTSVRCAVESTRVRMVQKLMAELKVLIGKRAPAGGAAVGPSPAPPGQQQYTRRDLKANLNRHMSIVLDRSVKND